MVKDKEAHLFFRISYDHIVRELITDAAIKFPSALSEGNDSLRLDVKAVWDTGATHTVITHKIATQLGLKPTGKAIAYGVNSQAIVNRYFVDIELPNKIHFPNFEVTESDLNSPNIDILIGMDIIQQGDFLITNAGGKTTFSFCIPSLDETIDLLKISKQTGG